MSSPPTELKIERTFVPANAGSLRQTAKGDVAYLHYTGTLYTTGAQFDSSLRRDPLRVTLGENEVIEGWEEGLLGMVQGEKRRLTIPPNKAYGTAGSKRPGSTEYIIPPNSVLVFDVELVPPPPNKK